MTSKISRLIRLIRLLPALMSGRLRLQGIPDFDVPLRCDGQGKVKIGSKVGIGYLKAPLLGSGMVRLQARSRNAMISVGANTQLSNNVQIIAEQSVQIGCECLIGDSVLILDSDFHHIAPALRNEPNASAAPIVLRNRVWIGSRAIILKGVEIGEGSVVAAGAVVTRSIPSGVVVAGNPAKIIREI
jgi:maltose O-acetyltransferase